MSDGTIKLSLLLERLDQALAEQAARLSAASAQCISIWRIDAGALRFHLASPSTAQLITVIIGGTGTGKSTLVNRLVGHTVTAASFRRTFTAGPVAVLPLAEQLPAGWLGVEHIPAATDQPPRGQNGAVMVVVDPEAPALLVDTPDLDGDEPANHVQADRAFRWAQRVIFVVTPEKYQMTELIPYYRLAKRYQIPSLFLMNKCEEPGVLDDFVRQLADRDWADASIFAIPRDDAAFEPPEDESLDALREHLKTAPPPAAAAGIRNRVADVVARSSDQVLAPLREARQQADELCRALHAMETPPVGVDVNPITDELRRRLQQRSVLYLVGPQRMLDRVRQVPMLVTRLPRATWDWVMRGQMPEDLNHPKKAVNASEPPNFEGTLSDHFTVVRSRIDDVLRSNPAAAKWIAEDAEAYRSAMIDPASAGMIALDEIQQLRDWLEKKWNATPRDTKVLQSLLKNIPGASKFMGWSEAVPYLMAIGFVAMHVAFWHFELPVLGGYTLVAWLTEKLSNEVSGRTRATNRRIGNRFERLAHEQIQRMCQWMDRQAPTARDLERLEKMVIELAEASE